VCGCVFNGLNTGCSFVLAHPMHYVVTVGRLVIGAADARDPPVGGDGEDGREV